jgi:hypothetical protein
MTSNKNNLFYLMQNPMISAIALHSFTLGYNNVSKNKRGKNPFPKLEYAFFVLPIVYNNSAMETFRSSNQLYTALINNKAIVLGLHERSTKMAGQTFSALNLAFSKNILNYNKEAGTIGLTISYPRRKLPLSLNQASSENTVKKIQDCAHKLGAIFAKKNEKNLQLELNIKF